MSKCLSDTKQPKAFGGAVNLSKDGMTLAIGSNSGQFSVDNSDTKGRIQVFQYDTESRVWMQDRAGSILGNVVDIGPWDLSHWRGTRD